MMHLQSYSAGPRSSFYSQHDADADINDNFHQLLINFSVDVNGLTDLSFARIWSSPSHFGARATFQTKDRVTSYLVVRDVGAKESGLYRCDSYTKTLKSKIIINTCST